MKSEKLQSNQWGAEENPKISYKRYLRTAAVKITNSADQNPD
jgi:hypothetical protein